PKVPYRLIYVYAPQWLTRQLRPNGRKWKNCMSYYKLVLVGAAMLFSASSAPAVTVETTDFISSPTYFNGFEGVTQLPVLLPGQHTVSYSEGGITVSAVSVPVSGGALEPIGSYDYWNGVGTFQWYAPLTGYSDIRLTSGGNFQSLPFLASSGFRG